MKPYWSKGGLTLFLGDSKELLPQLPKESYDMILTDPPYPAKYSWCWKLLAEESFRLLKKGTSCITFVGVINLQDAILNFHAAGMTYHWTGGQYHNAPTIINGRKVQCRWKPNLWYTKGIHREMDEKKWPCDFLITTHREKLQHEWQQPVGIFAYWLSMLSHKDEIILDPFCGAGTTMVAAQRMGRKCVGIEINERHCVSAIERLESEKDGFEFIVESTAKNSSQGFALRNLHKKGKKK